jgi:hypothetical protein
MKIRDLGSHVRNLAWRSLERSFKRDPGDFSRPIQHCSRCAVIFSLLAVGLSAKSVHAQTPQINSVQISGSAGNYTLTLNGRGFGKPIVSLPYRGDVPNFRVGDDAQVGHGEWGYTGDANILNYQSWSDSMVVVSEFGGQPCDSISIALWNRASQQAGTWGGNVPCTVTTPQITSVELSGTDASLQIVVRGNGFGSAPSAMPPPGTAGDLNYFWFIDFRAHCGSSSSLFEAGFERWGVNSPDSVTLFYQSWSDDQIVISGFGGAYGEGCAVYKAGDPIAIAVYNTSDASFTESQTAWGGPAAASLAISVKDLTTGKQIVSGGTITAGDNFQVTVTGSPEFNCAGQFVVTALGGTGVVPPSVIVQLQSFIIGPAVETNSVSGGVLTSNGILGHENDWKISGSCNGANTKSFAYSSFEFLSAAP